MERIEHGRLVEPPLFGGASLDQGLSYTQRRNTVWLTEKAREVVEIVEKGFRSAGEKS